MRRHAPRPKATIRLDDEGVKSELLSKLLSPCPSTRLGRGRMGISHFLKVLRRLALLDAIEVQAHLHE